MNKKHTDLILDLNNKIKSLEAEIIDQEQDYKLLLDKYYQIKKIIKRLNEDIETMDNF